MYCMKCGAQIPDEARFCPKCGTGVAQIKSGSDKTGSNGKTANFYSSPVWEIDKSKCESSKRKDKLKKYVIAAIGVIILIAFFANKPGRFSIEGKWQSVGDYGFGQAQPGSIVVFDEDHCNFFSPYDTYTLSREGKEYVLYVTSYGFSQTLEFDVEVIDKKHIKLSYSGSITELERVD